MTGKHAGLNSPKICYSIEFYQYGIFLLCVINYIAIKIFIALNHCTYLNIRVESWFGVNISLAASIKSLAVTASNFCATSSRLSTEL